MLDTVLTMIAVIDPGQGQPPPGSGGVTQTATAIHAAQPTIFVTPPEPGGAWPCPGLITAIMVITVLSIWTGLL